MTAAHGGTLGHCLLVELVPERNLALAILTNHTDGWRLIQDVERAALTALEGLTLDPAQAIGHRGVNETMPDAPILAKQPDAAPYVGIYRRPPSARTPSASRTAQLMLDNSAIAFYAPDRAVVTSGNSRGNPVEFIRKPDGDGRLGAGRRPDREKDAWIMIASCLRFTRAWPTSRPRAAATPSRPSSARRAARPRSSAPSLVVSDDENGTTDRDTRRRMRRGRRDSGVARNHRRAAAGHFARMRSTEELAWNTGLVCGGTMWILAEPGDEALARAAAGMRSTRCVRAIGSRPARRRRHAARAETAARARRLPGA